MFVFSKFDNLAGIALSSPVHTTFVAFISHFSVPQQIEILVVVSHEKANFRNSLKIVTLHTRSDGKTRNSQ